ncbi:aquaporin-like protein [Aspergillus ambiguus]|uniref:aquaporin-like protein n=1 Tax=Aspergillus ambiguus TaxID=176160 RepID=UPI003CCD3D4A
MRPMEACPDNGPSDMSAETQHMDRSAGKADAGDYKDFSLAGPQARNPGSAYVDPQYRQYNPQYGHAQQGPVWSLAQPLPHVVREGMLPEGAPQKQEKHDDRPAAHEPPTDTTKYEQEDPAAKVAKPDECGFFNRWSKIRHYIREPLAEWLGVTVAMTIGLCAGLATYTSQSQAGSFSSLAVAWGFGFMIAIYMAGGVSGGHLNPAITISLSVWRGFPPRKCVIYVLAQIIGAITAGGFAYAIYHDAILSSAAMSQVPQNQSNAAQALLTMPKQFVQPATAFFNEFLGTAILVGCLFALGDDTNAPPGAGMQAFIVGILITVLVLGLGYNTGG